MDPKQAQLIEPPSAITSNSEIELRALVERCNEALESGKRGGFDSLQAFRGAGAALVALKLLLPRGQFGPVARERCHCGKQWRARLIKLDQEWGNILAALRWAENRGSALGRKAFSVDGALALLREWRRRAENGDVCSEHGSRTAEPRSNSLRRQNAVLREKLSAALAYMVFLEAELARCRAAPSEWHEINPPARDKSRKVAALWLRGGTDGEHSSALNRFRELARRLGLDVRALLNECPIEGKADWTEEASS